MIMIKLREHDPRCYDTKQRDSEIDPNASKAIGILSGLYSKPLSTMLQSRVFLQWLIYAQATV